MIFFAAQSLSTLKPVAATSAGAAMLCLVVCYFRAPKSRAGKIIWGICRCVFGLTAIWYFIGGTVCSPYNLHRFAASPWYPMIKTLFS